MSLDEISSGSDVLPSGLIEPDNFIDEPVVHCHCGELAPVIAELTRQVHLLGVIIDELVSEYAALLRSDYGVTIEDNWAWDQYRRDAFAGILMAVIASQIVGGSDRSEAMFAAMATRSLRQALDLDSEALI